MKRICKTEGCHKNAGKGRNECHSCKKNKFIAKYPMKHAFNELQNRAKKRKIDFSLTFEQFKEFAIKHDYMAKKGIYRESMHIDRKIEEEGYHHWNIQPLKNHENISKYLNYDWEHGKFSVITTRTSTENDAFKDVPF